MKTLPDRFLSKVFPEPNSGCWLWDGCLNERGYGHFKVGHKIAKAHRFSYEHLVGPIPEGLEIDHKCRNRACVNPSHLEPVTHAENTRRGTAGINMRSRTHCPKGHSYSGDNLYVTGKGYRVCKACARVYEKRRVRVWGKKKDAIPSS